MNTRKHKAWWLEVGYPGTAWTAWNENTGARVEGKRENFQDPAWLKSKGLPAYIGRAATELTMASGAY